VPLCLGGQQWRLRITSAGKNLANPQAAKVPWALGLLFRVRIPIRSPRKREARHQGGRNLVRSYLAPTCAVARWAISSSKASGCWYNSAALAAGRSLRVSRIGRSVAPECA
jgi:hypothetical protein